MVRRIAGAELLSALLSTDRQLAVLDLRAPAERAGGHIAVGAGIPLHDLEQRVGRLVPNPGTAIVLAGRPDVDERGAALLEALGYRDVAVLDNGIDGWKSAGGRVYTGTNVRSKTLGEWIEHTYATPTVAADTVAAWQAAGERVVILDTRTPAEYLHHHIPGGFNTGGGAEVTYRAHQVIDDPATKVVINCQGRTRGIVGAQSLINTGIANPVFSLQNGTPAWEWAGQPLEYGAGTDVPAPDEVPAETLAWARRTLAGAGATILAAAAAQRHLDDAASTTYLLDVRSPGEFATAHYAAAISTPGGQLVQATDDFVAVRNARLVLVDTADLVRAANTVQWLQFLHRGPLAVVVFDPAADLVRAEQVTPAPAAGRRVTWNTLVQWRADGPVELVDVRSSARYAAGHVPGSVHARREHLDELAAGAGRVVLIGDNEFAAEHLADPRIGDVWVLDGGIAAAQEELVTDDARYAGEIVDRTGPPDFGPERDAWYAEYFDWELALLEESAGDPFFDFTAVSAT
ncbi:rhodanese-like domain-containing protein [Mycobacterium sp. 21AC1]|uniref:rhodanese-like domain-containing protein n=1 Tax=[Mycobacterium] appelbergii TaxID=2939269 RepID=UPI002938FC46|nr:rhodanese-like domain-containing protein [Mycobacterium sp. 21AC1]MDV3124994.1 rhodanese-like domain-containing protein [Mycobacterium sp. 21AC1]